MKNIAIMTAIGALFIAGPVLADTVASDAQDVHSDAGAVKKDQKALNKDRANKAADKANENYVGQAVDSVAIGEKKIEKSADKAILNQDKKDLGAAREKGDSYSTH